MQFLNLPCPIPITVPCGVFQADLFRLELLDHFPEVGDFIASNRRSPTGSRSGSRSCSRFDRAASRVDMRGVTKISPVDQPNVPTVRSADPYRRELAGLDPCSYRRGTNADHRGCFVDAYVFEAALRVIHRWVGLIGCKSGGGGTLWHASSTSGISPVAALVAAPIAAPVAAEVSSDYPTCQAPDAVRVERGAFKT